MKTVKNFNEVKIDPHYIVELIKNTGNDQELGSQIRKYYNYLKEKK